jgi:hypothetical protein
VILTLSWHNLTCKCIAADIAAESTHRDVFIQLIDTILRTCCSQLSSLVLSGMPKNYCPHGSCTPVYPSGIRDDVSWNFLWNFRVAAQKPGFLKALFDVMISSNPAFISHSTVLLLSTDIWRLLILLIKISIFNSASAPR